MPARDMNVWNATGRIGTEPEMRFTPTGQAVTEFRFAVGRVWKDAQGERKEATTWISVVCWGQLAEQVNAHMTKGERVGITGRLDLQEWEDRASGERRSKHIITANDVYFLEGRREATGEHDALSRARGAALDRAGEVIEDDVPF